MQLLPEFRPLERSNCEEHNAEAGSDDLLPLLLRLEGVGPLVRHYGAPVADALLEGVVVVSLVVVVAGGVAAGVEAGAEE
jgi:hypothetical protein